MGDKPFGFYFFLFIILFLFFKFYELVYSFLPAIATGCVLAYLLNPIYLYILRRTGKKPFSALSVIIINIILILVPLLFIVLTLQQQVQYIMQIDMITYVRTALENLDRILSERLQIQLLDRYISDLIAPLMTAGQNAIRLFVPRLIMSVTQIILSAFIAFFLMYYLLINSKRVISIIRYYGPLSDENMSILLDEMGRDTKTLILGQLLIAVIQGVLASIGFVIFGIPAVVLWGLVCVLTSFLPVLGAGLVWFPACVYLFMQDHYFSALGLFIWGAIIVSSADNLIRPKLVNMLGEIHPVTVLLGVFIGIKEWGLIGVVLGPLIISVLIILIKMFREQFLDTA
ncbi:AI-2E family transporter [Candidatus Latescibacterota bacterium]